MIHANIEFLNFWNFLISETYSFLEHFRSSIKIYGILYTVAKAKSMKRIQKGSPPKMERHGNRTVFKYSFQLPFDVKFKKLELQIESGTELRK